MLLALCAIWKGDLSMWRRAKVHIAEAPYKNDMDRDIISFSITAVDSMLYNVSSFPEWFKIGCFEPLHKDSLPAAKVYYAKYLYAAGYAVATKELVVEGVEGLSLMRVIPFAIEPMISQAMADNSIIAEIYLRMTCAVIYHNSGNSNQAIRHIDKAISLALPDKLYGLLAEYCRTLGSLLELRLKNVDEAAWNEVKSLYEIYSKGWAKLSGSVRGRTILTTLTEREREIAKLAAFGMQYQEIAERVNMSLSGVKQSIKNISDKSGLSRKEFAAIL
jgi:DNA-binding CsgD family transcriptional regulator